MKHFSHISTFYLFIYFVCKNVGEMVMWMCAGDNHMEVKRQIAEVVFSFQNADPRGQIQVIRLGGKPLTC